MIPNPVESPLAAISMLPTRESLRLLATLALDAYSDHNNWPGCEVRRIQHYDSGMAATIVSDHHQCVVSFRGTEPTDFKDWKRDASVFLTDWDLGRVHGGFRRGWRALQASVVETLNELQAFADVYAEFTNRLQVIVNGHSLGGAVATLSALDLKADLCVTFGSPRVGDDVFSQYYDAIYRHRHLRVVHSNDVVPRVPCAFNYRHCGTLVYLDRKRRIVVDPSFYTVTVDRVLGYRWDLIRDHLLGSYLEALT